MADSQELLLQQIKEQGELVRKLKAAKESSEKVCVSNKGREQYDLVEIDLHFSQYSYVCGYTPSNCDVILAKNLDNTDFAKFKYIKRWWDHMRSFSPTEVSNFPFYEPPDLMKGKPEPKSSLQEQVCEWRSL